jgi:dTDP-4-amino-4,6-dideoxygalactose transaminase
MIPYSKHQVTPEDEAAVLRVLRSDRLTQGPEVQALEADLCRVSGAQYAVAVSSGTAALHLAYLAAGLGPGKTLVTTPLSFVATANAALYCGAEVSFQDGLSMELPSLDGYCLVAFGGDPPAWYLEPPPVIVDACHGPIQHNGNALATVLSCHPCKHVAAGEGGAVLTNERLIANTCMTLRDHGRRIHPGDKYDFGSARYAVWEFGYNYRLDEMSAALARSQLSRYEWGVERRRLIASMYDLAMPLQIEVVQHSAYSARHLYQILVDADKRDAIREQLAQRGVGTQVHYHPIIPLQPYYRQRYGYTYEQAKERWPRALEYSERAISLPLFPTMTDQEIETVICAVLEVCG